MKQVLDTSLLQQFDQDCVPRHGLPGAAYVSERFHELEQEHLFSRYLTLFPNFVLGTYAPDQIGVHLNVPVDAGTTSQLRVIYLHQDTRYSESEIEDLKGLWQEVHREDHAMCERLQTGRHSQLSAQGGLLSPYWETSVRKFQELLADAIRPGLGRK